MKKPLVIFAMSVQLVILLAMVGRQEWILHSPQVVTLRTAPLDPQDAMRGDYANFHFEVGDVPRKFWSKDLALLIDTNADGYRDELRDHVVYGTLAPDPEMIYNIESLAEKRPPSGTFLRGYIVSANRDTLQVRWGIESYYLQQGESAKLEATQRQAMAGVPLYAQVAVAFSGLASVKSYDWAPLGISLSFETKLMPPVSGAREGRRVAVAVDVELRNVSKVPLKIATGENCFRLVADDPPNFRYGAVEPRFLWVQENAPRGDRPAAVIALEPGGKYTFHLNLQDPAWFVREKKPGLPLGDPISLAALPDSPRCRIEYNPPRLAPEGTREIPHYIHLRSRAFNGARVD